MSTLLVIAAVYVTGYIVAFTLICEDDGPVALLIGFAWPAIVAVMLYIRWREWRALPRSPRRRP